MIFFIVSSKSKIGIKGYILDHWEGNFSLVKSFWINGFLLNIIIAIPLFYAQINFDSISNTAANFFLLYYLFYTAYFIWVNVGIWKSSKIYIANKKNSRFWAYLARLIILLSVLRAIVELVVGF